MSDRHAWALGVLAVRPGDSVLEVGCGHGVTATHVCGCLDPALGGRYLGIDRSATMTAAAGRRNADHVAAGTASFVTSTFVDAEPAGAAAGAIDVLYAFHVADFWRRPGPTLGAARRWLAPSGRLHLLNALPGWNQRATAEAFVVQLTGVLDRHGFTVDDTVVDDVDGGPVVRVRAAPPPSAAPDPSGSDLSAAPDPSGD
jgi:SAM-dependent methyltransferase